ncbi:indole-3-glycerol phosphate synthase TrpC [Brevibacillus sp. H7]|jgi:indole-3-glycerol phosphate synthase|uniref:indole-3-glycerol phosphate synthase TrpC n=1 Tax=Brevibacillus sp. H7 TaxID=3349138 RepID=UPI003816A0E0
MLRKIVETKKEEVARLKQRTTMQSLLDQASFAPPVRDFHRALVDSPRPVSVIAEVKKASPSKGVIREDFEPVTLAQAYASADAEAISVLTDETYFQGSLQYLRCIREAVAQPLLRKDFLIDEMQVAEARTAGADCILLIAAILEGNQLRHLFQTASALGMDVLLEVHDRKELELVFRYTEPKLLGINNRNLRTFETNVKTTAELAALVPPGVAVVSESGIGKRQDIECVLEAGARAVLVGEHFMRQADVRQAVIDLAGERLDLTGRVGR